MPVNYEDLTCRCGHDIDTHLPERCDHKACGCLYPRTTPDETWVWAGRHGWQRDTREVWGS